MNIISTDEAALCRIYCKDYDREWFEFYDNNVFKYINHVPLKFIERFKYVSYMLYKAKKIRSEEKDVTMAVPICFSDLTLLANLFNKEPDEIEVKSVLIPSESNNYYSHRIFFQSKSGLSLSIIFNHINEVESVNLGYVLDKKEIKCLKSQIISYILFGKGKYFCEYKNTLSDSEVEEFISVIAYLHKYLKSKDGRIIYANKY